MYLKKTKKIEDKYLKTVYRALSCAVLGNSSAAENS